uniref:Protein phosphatase n=1 Tax=Soboliphyme baturini TaxID=241478 RepID=A0A183IXM2_9BILA
LEVSVDQFIIVERGVWVRTCHIFSCLDLGVADGVGGWHSYGIDPSRFSRYLMRICAQMVLSGQFTPTMPAQLIANSYKKLAAQSSTFRRPVVGSSTACVVVLDRSNSKIHTANIGDSGFVVVRNGTIVHRSSEQQHYFNAPFQLTLLPNQQQDVFFTDSPDSAETTSFQVQVGDLILVATDGLFDNISSQAIEEQLATLTTFDSREVQMACNSIAFQARRLSFDPNHMSPFAKKAQMHGVNADGKN